MRTAIYSRVSTNDQTCENQLIEPRRYCESRGWAPQEFVDQGVSGAKESRPALDALLKDARRRRFDAVVVWRLDRLGGSLRHLILTLDDLSELGVAFVSLGRALTPPRLLAASNCTSSKRLRSSSGLGLPSGFVLGSRGRRRRVAV